MVRQVNLNGLAICLELMKGWVNRTFRPDLEPELFTNIDFISTPYNLPNHYRAGDNGKKRHPKKVVAQANHRRFFPGKVSGHQDGKSRVSQADTIKTQGQQAGQNRSLWDQSQYSNIPDTIMLKLSIKYRRRD